MWADLTDHIILTEDAATFVAELAAHLRLGRTSAGVCVIRLSATVASILSWLELVVADDYPDQWTDRVTYIP